MVTGVFCAELSGGSRGPDKVLTCRCFDASLCKSTDRPGECVTVRMKSNNQVLTLDSGPRLLRYIEVMDYENYAFAL